MSVVGSILGPVIGTILAVDTVDSLIGSPAKRALGLMDDPEIPAVGPLGTPRQRAMEYVQGVNSYLKRSENFQPGWTQKHSSELTESVLDRMYKNYGEDMAGFRKLSRTMKRRERHEVKKAEALFP